MNIIRELRKSKGVQQKELAIVMGVSQPTVSEWESNKKDPSGENLKKLANYFGVDELTILGVGSVTSENTNRFTPVDPKISGRSETEQILNYLLEKLNAPISEDYQPKTDEARTLAKGIDRLQKAQREQALNVVKAMFVQYADYFEQEKKNDESEL